MVSRPRLENVLVIQVPLDHLASDAMTPALSYPSTGFPARVGMIARGVEHLGLRASV